MSRQVAGHVPEGDFTPTPCDFSSLNFAGPVGSDDRQQLTRLDAKRNASDGNLIGEGFMEIMNFDHAEILLGRSTIGIQLTSGNDRFRRCISLGRTCEPTAPEGCKRAEKLPTGESHWGYSSDELAIATSRFAAILRWLRQLCMMR